MHRTTRHHASFVAATTGAALVLAMLPAVAEASADDGTLAMCFGLEVTIRGTGHRDVIHGTPGDDVIAGGRGGDQIYGGDGNDTICGEDGNDRLYGEDGDDRLDAGTGLRSGEHPGGDNVDGGPGNDTIEGGDDGDHDDLYFASATGGITVDLETGLTTGPGIGTDTVSGIDHVYGTEFRDRIIGAEYVNAGARDDVVLRGRVIQGGPGDDRMTTLLDSGGYINGQSGDDRGRNAWVQFGKSGNDVLIGGASVDQLTGGEGDDELRGHGSTDYLQGDSGNDILRGGPEFDEATYLEEKGGVVIDGRAGTAITPSGLDSIRGVESVDTTVYADVVKHIEVVDSTRGNDRVSGARLVNAGQGHDILTGRRLGSELHGSSGNDIIRGGAGPDLLFGDEDNDRILGADANDSLNGGDGDDYLDGGAQTDTGDGGLGTDTCVNIETAVACELEDGAGAVVTPTRTASAGLLRLPA